MSDTAVETKPVEETSPAEQPTKMEDEAIPTSDEQTKSAEAQTDTAEAAADTAKAEEETTTAEKTAGAEETANAEAAEAEQPEPEPEPIEIPAGNGELVLVTGACGYLGSHIVKLLVDGGEYRVRGTVRSVENNDKLDSLKSLLENSKYPPEFVEADLMKAESWAEAVKGCEYVIHVASPFPSTQPTNPSEVIEPAREGTLSVLKACADSGTVRRVVITSSCAAIYCGKAVTKEPLTEAVWAEPEKAGTSYFQSKIVAEQAAWDFVEQQPEGSSMELSVVNPGLILGPPLIKTDCTSIELVKNLMHRKWPMLPKLSFPVIDVRDVALAHIRAMVIKQAAGQRHITASTTYWVKDIANFLSQEFSNKGFNVATTQAPYVLTWIKSHVDPEVKQLLPDIGKLYLFDNSRMKNVLQVEPRPAKDTVVEMGHSLINFGIAQKVEKPEKKARKLTFRKKKSVKEEDEEKKDEPEKIKDDGSAQASTDSTDPEEVKVEVNCAEGSVVEAVPKEQVVEEPKEEAVVPAVEDPDKIEAAAVSSEEEAKEETPDPESSKVKQEKPKKEKKKGLSFFSFKSKTKKHVEKKSVDKPSEEVEAAADDTPKTDDAAATEQTAATSTEVPDSTKEAPASTEEAPASTEEAPASTEEAPASTEESPASTEEAPASTEEAPASTEEAPASTEEAPANTTTSEEAAETTAADTSSADTPAAE